MSYMGQTLKSPPKEFPESAQALNWGAFWLFWLWGPMHGYWTPLWVGLVTLILSVVIPFALLVPKIYYLIKGNEIAWDVKDWPSVDAFHASQRKWAMWSTVVMAIPIVLGISAAIVIPILLQVH